MKEVLKCAVLLTVGLFTAVVGYPFLHESGHSLAALLTGAEIARFNLFPLPYIVCEVNGISRFDLTVIGLGGMYFPLILSLIYRPKLFLVWYAVFVTKSICVLSFAISIISIVLYYFGVVIENEDIIKVISIWREGTAILVILMIFAIIITIRSIIKQKPLSKILRYFEMDNK